MKIKCPKCETVVPPHQVEMANDEAFCENCDEIFKVSQSLTEKPVNPDELLDAPAGAWMRKEDDAVIVGASLRSGLSIFLSIVMGGVMAVMLLLLINGKLSLHSDIEGGPGIINIIAPVMVCMMSVMVSIFILVALFGKVEVVIGKSCSAFLGVGPLGWKRKFDWEAVEHIDAQDFQDSYEGSGKQVDSGVHVIVLEGKNRLALGHGLTKERAAFIAKALKYLKSE